MENIDGYQAARLEVERMIGRPMTEDFIKLLNSMVVGKERSDFRKIGAQVTNRLKIRVYLAPFAEWVPELTKQLIKWLNTEGLSDDALIIAAIFHRKFVKIHPFCVDKETNGNGRTARLLTTFILRSAGFDTKECYALEDFFEKNKEEYYVALEGSPSWDPNEDMGPWIEYFRSSMAHVMRDNI